MNVAAASRIERLVADATGSLHPASLWLAATCIPDDCANLKLGLGNPSRIQSWLRQEAGNWPAPLKVGDQLRETSRDEALVFAPLSGSGTKPAHHVALYADGSSLFAVEIGALKDADTTPGSLWAIGEGSIAWLTVCFARCAAQWAIKAGARGSASIDLRFVSSAPSDDQVPLQLWSFAGGTNAPCGHVLLKSQPSQAAFDIADGRTGQVVHIARLLLLPLLAQFGLVGSRHIDGTGTLISTNFVGHAPRIEAWAREIGVSFISSSTPVTEPPVSSRVGYPS